MRTFFLVFNLRTVRFTINQAVTNLKTEFLLKPSKQVFFETDFRGYSLFPISNVALAVLLSPPVYEMLRSSKKRNQNE